jgi:putative pyridoxal-dependent aspartate 1-decarboxylase
VASLFAEQVQNNPDNTALVFGEIELTYCELDVRVNKLASLLIKNGVQSQHHIGICLERSIESVISILASVKLKIPYIPLDPSYPESRLEYMFNKAELAFVISRQEIVETLTFASDATVVNIDSPELVQQPAEAPQVTKVNDSLLTIFTSGSTGSPKAISLQQASVLNRLNWFNDVCPLKNKDVCIHKTSMNFVDHVAEVLQPLTSNGTLHIVSDEDVMDTARLISLMIKHSVTRVTLIPSLLKAMMSHAQFVELVDLRTIICSGETLPLSIAQKASSILPLVRIFNFYGSSEVTADVTAHEITQNSVTDVMSYFSETEGVKFEHTNLHNEVQELALLDSDSFTTPNVDFHSLKDLFKDYQVPELPASMDGYLAQINESVFPYLINVSKSNYIGHMTSALPNFMPEFARVMTILNQNMVKVETSKSLSLLERQVLAMIHQLFYQKDDEFYKAHVQDPFHVFGVITSGGSLANITALLTSRNNALMKLGYGKTELRQRGANEILREKGYDSMAILCSPMAHYSVKKALVALGMGEKDIRVLDIDENLTVQANQIKTMIDECQKERRLVIALVGIAGATETGNIDPLPVMADIAEQRNIHFHVDAAWGGAFQFSERYKKRIKGVERADTITFCAHKQLYLPQGISVCVIKNTDLNGILPVHANYQSQPGTFDLGQYSLEGSRPALSLLMHAAFHLISKTGYEALIQKSMDNTRMFRNLLVQNEAFWLVAEPQLNIINYVYVPKAVRYAKGKALSEMQVQAINDATDLIQRTQFDRGSSFVSRTRLRAFGSNDGLITVFRVVVSNPLVSYADFEQVLQEQLDIASELADVDSGNQSVLGLSLTKSAQEQWDNWSVPLGQPIANTKIYILDLQNNLLPVSAKGEICVAGYPVTGGYLNDPELTAKHFVPDPFNPGGTIFKTGDIGRWNGLGQLEYFGRNDQQVKRRGFRIELGEIENQLLKVEGVENAVVSLVKGKGKGTRTGNDWLYAYVSGSMDEFSEASVAERALEPAYCLLNTNTLNTKLKEFLPSYMLPDAFVWLPALPLLPNGKINRSVLPTDFEVSGINKYEAPQNSLEKAICEIWADALNKEQIGSTDDYFLLGGHSLLATTTINELNTRFSTSISVAMMFEYPTPRTFAIAMQAITDINLCGNEGDDAEVEEADEDEISLTI